MSFVRFTTNLYDVGYSLQNRSHGRHEITDGLRTVSRATPKILTRAPTVSIITAVVTAIIVTVITIARVWIWVRRASPRGRKRRSAARTTIAISSSLTGSVLVASTTRVVPVNGIIQRVDVTVPTGRVPFIDALATLIRRYKPPKRSVVVSLI